MWQMNPRTLSMASMTACLLILGFTGCSRDDGPEETVSTPVDNETISGLRLTLGGVEPAQNDTFVTYYSSDPDTLNLLTSNDNISTAFQRHVYEPLAERNLADPADWIPVLAESWEFDEENLEYTIHLRKGVMWHPITRPDGVEIPAREFTARDVVFTFECILNEFIEASHSRNYYYDPESDSYKIAVTLIDNYTVSIKWTQPYFMADEYSIGMECIPRHVYSVDRNGEPISLDFSSREFAEGFNNHWANTLMCGTGPLIFEEWNKGYKVSMRRNPHYWGNPYYFSKVVYNYQTNPQTAVQQVLHNELDWASITEGAHYVEAQDHENVLNGKVNLVDYIRTSYRYMGYNFNRPQLAEREVRWALSHAVPIDDIIENLYFGLAERQTGPFVMGGKFANPGIELISFDLEESRRILDEAGWVDKNRNGVREKEIDGETVELEFELMIFADSPQYLTIAELIKGNFRSIGVDVRIAPAKWDLMLQRLRQKDFDAVILGWTADWKSDPFQLWHSSQAEVMNSSNSIGYQNPEVDALIDKLRVTLSEEEQVPLYHEIHRLLYEDQPYTFLFAERTTVGIDARIENIEFYPMLRPHLDRRKWHTTSPRILANGP